MSLQYIELLHCIFGELSALTLLKYDSFMRAGRRKRDRGGGNVMRVRQAFFLAPRSHSVATPPTALV
jgi:hypothetical protein